LRGFVLTECLWFPTALDRTARGQIRRAEGAQSGVEARVETGQHSARLRGLDGGGTAHGDRHSGRDWWRAWPPHGLPSTRWMCSFNVMVMATSLAGHAKEVGAGGAKPGERATASSGC
jgi:hypothetical protein